MKRITAKGLRINRLLIIISALMLIIPYAVYQVYHYYFGIDLDRLYFITSSLATVISFSVIYRSYNDTIIKTISIWVVSFFLILLIAYIISGLILGVSYVYIKWALSIGTLTGLIYWLYDYITGVKT